MSAIKVSIIVPIYNVEKYLSKCLNSLITQTLKDIEIICINDGSTDDSLSILQEYVQKDCRIKIINKENEGQGRVGERVKSLTHAEGNSLMKKAKK